MWALPTQSKIPNPPVIALLRSPYYYYEPYVFITHFISHNTYNISERTNNRFGRISINMSIAYTSWTSGSSRERVECLIFLFHAHFLLIVSYYVVIPCTVESVKYTRIRHALVQKLVNGGGILLIKCDIIYKRITLTTRSDGAPWAILIVSHAGLFTLDTSPALP